MNECNKIPFPNRKETKAAMNSYNKEHENKAKSAYKCPYCGYWHFTTMKRSRAKEQRKWHQQNVENNRK